jgi:hypothetical protein
VTVRVAVGLTPLTATRDEAVPAAVAAVEDAGRLGARNRREYPVPGTGYAPMQRGDCPRQAGTVPTRESTGPGPVSGTWPRFRAVPV